MFSVFTSKIWFIIAKRKAIFSFLLFQNHPGNSKQTNFSKKFYSFSHPAAIYTGCNSAEAHGIINIQKLKPHNCKSLKILFLSSQEGHVQCSRKLRNQRWRDGFFRFHKNLFFVFGQANSLNVFSSLFVKVLTVNSM